MQKLVSILESIGLAGPNSLYQKFQNNVPQHHKKYYYIFGFLVLNTLLKKLKARQEKSVSKNTVLELDLDTQIFVNYSSEDDPFLAKLLKKPVQHDFLSLIEGINQAAEDPNVIGMVVKTGSMTQFGLSQIEEFIQQIKYFRSKGKKAICYCEYIGLFSRLGSIHTYLVSSFDKVFVQDTGLVCFNSLVAEKSYAKEALGKLGINFDLYRRKDYKTALNVLNNEKMDDQEREMYDSILETIQRIIVEEVSKNRNLSEEKVLELIGKGPFTPQEAKQEGLIDDVLYRDQVYDYLKDQQFKDVKKINYLYFTHYIQKKGRKFIEGKKNKTVAFINACGPIQEGESKIPNAFDSALKMGSYTICRQIRKAYNDKNVIGIVFRIDSPGGSVLASDQIHREIEVAKSKGKRVVCVYSNVSASGGVYISCGADKIVCTPLTVTGSIGVIFGHFNFRAMWKKLGITFDGTKTKDTPETNFYTMLEDYNEEDRKRANFMVDQTYTNFTSKVANGRKMGAEEVEEKAQGRVWMGYQAKEKNLVDSITQGTYMDSIALMAELTNTPLKDIKLMRLPEKKSFLEKLLEKSEPKNEEERDRKAAITMQNMKPESLVLKTFLGQYCNIFGFQMDQIQNILCGGQRCCFYSFEAASLNNHFLSVNQI